MNEFANYKIVKARNIRRRRVAVIFMLILYVPIIAVFDSVYHLENISIVFAIFYLILIILIGLIQAITRCPNCGKFFFTTKIHANFFSSKCLNCGFDIRKTRN
jgi:hypothetical protein